MLTVAAQEQMRAAFMETHYTLAELAEQWRMDTGTLRNWFVDEPGVIKFGRRRLTKGKDRPYVSLRVPESVALRVYRRMTGKEIHQSAASHPGA
jgi:hypothetical protein